VNKQNKQRQSDPQGPPRSEEAGQKHPDRGRDEGRDEEREQQGQDEEPDLSQDLHAAIIRVLKTVYDPEIPVNIYEIGLIYSIDIDPDKFVHLRMTLTSPGCPVAESLPMEVEAKVRAIPGVRDVVLELVWDPPWTLDKMSEAARLTLGF
jgi:FeS assembly SUF system protein